MSPGLHFQLNFCITHGDNLSIFGPKGFDGNGRLRMWSKQLRLDFCENVMLNLTGVETTGIAGINDNGDMARLMQVFLLFPWEDENARANWFGKTFNDRPGDLLWVLSLSRQWKEMGLTMDQYLGD